MTKLTKKSPKGITLVTLSIAIIIMLIITSTLIYNITTGSKVRALNNMYQDITKLKDKIDLYYTSYQTIPILSTPYTNTTRVTPKNPNDGNVYYVIDLEALEGLDLHYGSNYETYKENTSQELTDIYIINEASHTVYYVKGIEMDGNRYYTIPDEYTKVKLNAEKSIVLSSLNENIGIIKIMAVDKANGIKQMKILVDGKEQETFTYDSNIRDKKIEFVDIAMIFGQDYQVSLELIDENNEVTNYLQTLVQTQNIATEQGLKNLATKVNAGTSFSGKTINLCNDLDLKGSEENKWVPIGTESQYFQGTFEGNGCTIHNLYINETTKGYNGLFGKSSGIVRNVSVDGIIKTTEDFIGGIVAFNLKGIVENCSSNIQIETTYNSSGGIIGENNGGTVRNCISQGKVTGGMQIGGIVGHLTNGGKISDCYNKATVQGTSYGIGAITGTAYGGATITNCYNIGNVSTTNEGYVRYTGIIGWKVDGTATNCYYLEGSQMQADANATVKTSEELKQLASTLGSAFKEDTNYINEGYPILTWQN